MKNKGTQQSFVPLFLMILTFDCLAAVAVATEDPIWGHLAMMWNGPADDILYLVAACQALFFLLDPTGEVTTGGDTKLSFQRILAAFSDGKGLERTFASQFMTGAKTALTVLPGLLTCSISLAYFWSNPVSIGVNTVVYRHLSLVFPIFLLAGAVFHFLRMAPDAAGFWKVTGLGWAGILLVTAVDGRWSNHLYHSFRKICCYILIQKC